MYWYELLALQTPDQMTSSTCFRQYHNNWLCHHVFLNQKLVSFERMTPSKYTGKNIMGLPTGQQLTLQIGLVSYYTKRFRSLTRFPRQTDCQFCCQTRCYSGLSNRLPKKTVLELFVKGRLVDKLIGCPTGLIICRTACL